VKAGHSQAIYLEKLKELTFTPSLHPLLVKGRMARGQPTNMYISRLKSELRIKYLLRSIEIPLLIVVFTWTAYMSFHIYKCHNPLT